MKTINYGKKKLRLKEMSLGLRKDSGKLLLKLRDLTIKPEEAEGKIWDFIHDEENIKNIFEVFIEAEDINKIKIDWVDDGNYLKMITLAQEILTGFFAPKQT